MRFEKPRLRRSAQIAPPPGAGLPASPGRVPSRWRPFLFSPGRQREPAAYRLSGAGSAAPSPRPTPGLYATLEVLLAWSAAPRSGSSGQSTRATPTIWATRSTLGLSRRMISRCHPSERALVSATRSVRSPELSMKASLERSRRTDRPESLSCRRRPVSSSPTARSSSPSSIRRTVSSASTRCRTRQPWTNVFLPFAERACMIGADGSSGVLVAIAGAAANSRLGCDARLRCSDREMILIWPVPWEYSRPCAATATGREAALVNPHCSHA